MSYLGDYDVSTVIHGKFTTFRPSTGAAYTLALAAIALGSSAAIADNPSSFAPDQGAVQSSGAVSGGAPSIGGGLIR